ncbi:MAG: hypothetical protein R3D59_19080, partial [Paracoccaceae bacterium]
MELPRPFAAFVTRLEGAGQVLSGRTLAEQVEDLVSPAEPFLGGNQFLAEIGGNGLGGLKLGIAPGPDRFSRVEPLFELADDVPAILAFAFERGDLVALELTRFGRRCISGSLREGPGRFEHVLHILRNRWSLLEAFSRRRLIGKEVTQHVEHTFVRAACDRITGKMTG